MSFPNKFRIWGRESKRWVGPIRVELDNEGRLFDLQGEMIFIDQWTGLLDAKTSQPIYENDIVSFTIRGAAHGRERDDVANVQVWWSQEDVGWVFGKWTRSVDLFDRDKWVPTGKTYDWWYSPRDDGFDLSTLVVIGNVHENIELLSHTIVK